MLDARGVRAVGGAVTRAAARDGFLDLATALASGPVEPRLLGARDHHAGELPHRRPVELPVGEGTIEQGQPGKGVAHAEPLLGLTAFEPNHTLGILGEARVTRPCGDIEPLGGEEPATELTLVAGTLDAELGDATMHHTPVGDGLRLDLAPGLCERLFVYRALLWGGRLLADNEEWRAVTRAVARQSNRCSCFPP